MELANKNVKHVDIFYIATYNTITEKNKNVKFVFNGR